ncbi:MAG: polysaccharide biosynthesis C-terminal domain-containing protein [Clostridia bacterium]|nr:polysaccharide biosynthesis C-terminal domain-containing protein [Clostridium sp.]
MLNLILVPIPSIGVNGAAIASVACHLVAFMISIVALKRTIKLNLSFPQFVIKPIIATGIMAVCSYFIYSALSGIISANMATIVAIISAMILYGLSIIALKVFKKEEIEMLPYGNKLCKILEKLKIY